VRRLAGGLLATLAVAACTPATQPAPPAPSPESSGPTAVYVALGASESAGVGTADPARDAFPQRFFHHLGAASVLYDFGIPGETTAAALKDELPPALAVEPTLATVWFNVDDLVAGVPVADFEARLDQLVSALHRAGATRILVANTPHLDRLPAYFACRPNPPAGSAKCPLTGLSPPPPAELDALVQAYNAAIARVAARQGATVVDLYAAGEVPDQHPEYVSADGFHPSTQGAAAIADTFAAALGLPPAPPPA
jgi:lysophospholipase L1-like esterase